MIVVLQRVLNSEVVIDGERVAKGGQGLLLLAGVEKGDDENDAVLMAEKNITRNAEKQFAILQ